MRGTKVGDHQAPKAKTSCYRIPRSGLVQWQLCRYRHNGHVWQQSHGTPPRRCYHDKEWAAKMREIGLQPSTTGEPGGRETGQSVTHYIVPGGPFARAYAKVAATGFQLNWQSVPFEGGERKKEGGQQDQVHLSHLRRERLGEASDEADLRGLLRRGRRRNHDAGA